MIESLCKAYGYDAAGRMLKYEATSKNQTFNNTAPLHAIKNTGYVYDANGNMTTRPTAGGNQTLIWDAENHLVMVSGGGIPTENYLYDDSGNRVKVSRGTQHTYQPFPHYQIDNGTVEKYYYFNGQRIAMKRSSTLTYLHNDHLGSPALTTSGTISSTLKLYAYGKRRATTGSLPTRYQFTGQYYDDSGLTYMNARYYDPSIGLFVSPDMIVPDAGLAVDYNRFMYARGNSLKYNDPSGHCVWDLCLSEGALLWLLAGAATGTGTYYYYNASPYAEENREQTVAAVADLVTDIGDLISPNSEQSSAPSVIADPLPTEQKPIVTTFPMADESPTIQATGITGDSSTQTIQLPGFSLVQPSAGDNVVSASNKPKVLQTGGNTLDKR